MNRIGSYSQSYTLQQTLLNRQQQFSLTQRQVASGFKAETFKGYAQDAGALLATKSVLERNATYTGTAKSLKLKLGQYDAAMTGLRSSAENIKQELIGAIAKRDASNLMNQITQIFNLATSQLTTQIDGKYIFGGTRTDRTPLDFETIDDLLALPDASSGFVNNQSRSEVQVDDGLLIQDGILADELGSALMEVVRNVARFDRGPLDSGGGDVLLDGSILAGATQLTLDGSLGTLSGGVVVGDTITFAGDTSQTVYTITNAATAAGNAITIDFTPPLAQSIADNTAVSLGGPLGSEITPQQRLFLESQLALIADASKSIDQVQAQNGIKQAQLEDILDRHEAQKVALKSFESDLQEVDLTEAISRLNQDQIALEANLQVVSQIGRLSLLNFLR